MPADQPYNLGFVFQEVVGVHFSSEQWFAFTASQPANPNFGTATIRAFLPTNIRFDFWIDDVLPSSFPTGPRIITNAMLTGKAPAAAGARPVGFTEWVFLGTPGRITPRVWLKMGVPPFHRAFTVRYDYTFVGPLGNLSSITVSTVARDGMRAGLSTLGGVSLALGQEKLINNTGSASFRVNPTTLEVTGPF